MKSVIRTQYNLYIVKTIQYKDINIPYQSVLIINYVKDKYKYYRGVKRL